jgi:hypothetical protein
MTEILPPDASAPRGIRNCNPGNIDLSAITYDGEIKPSRDPRFATFATMEKGVRAIVELMIVYHNDHHLNTIRGIINRWAPPVENNTSTYVTDVAAQCGVHPDDLYPVTQDDMAKLVYAIICHENGATAAAKYVGPDICVTAVTDAEGSL